MNAGLGDGTCLFCKPIGPRTAPGPGPASGRPALQAFAGSLEGQRASKGVFFATSFFTKEAEEDVHRISRQIVLIDGQALTRLMDDDGIGVRSSRSLSVKRVNGVCF